MNREVEERIVKMYFDNKDFEKNAKTTIDTLDELKNGLKMDESAKGLQIFEKIGKTLDFSNSTKGLTKLKTGLKSMEGILGKMFKIGEEPVREAEHVVGQIRSMFTRVIGYDIAGRMVSSIENAIRSLTIAPISAGWTQYEQKMDNVKTIMSSTGESIEVVQKHLTSLTDYANKTIYSLSDMTSNLGKFTNNGMKLEDSVKAMQGIANAAADAGQGAQQASMAMYNFSQAMGVGKMTTIDWKSIENANMATTRLKNTFIEMAAANGDLQKEFDETDKKYHYYITRDSKGQALKDKKKWTEVTISNFRETLSKDWLTAQSMMRALMVYSGEQIDPDTLKSWGITDPDEIKNLEKIGKDALEAATQVRTFTKMMDALRESVQSGWAESFELIFGNMPQGTNFWTDLNNELGEILDKSKEIRNNILKIWSGNYVDTTKQEEELSEKNELLKQAQERLEKLIESEDLNKNDAKIKRYLELIESNSQKLAELKADNKGGKNNVKIKNLQTTIDDYKKKSKELQKLNEDLAKKIEKREKTQTEIDAIQGQIDLYKSEIAGLRNTLSYTTDPDQYNKQLKNITEKERAMAKLQKKLDELKKAQDSDELLKTKKEVEALMKEVEELNNEIDEANKKPKSSIIDEQGRTGREILIDSIKDIIALAKELGGTFSDAFHNVFGTMDAQKLFDLTKAFENAVLNVKNWLHEGKAGETRIDKIRKILEGVFSVVKIGFNVLKAGFNLVKRIAKPVLEFLIDRFAKVGEFFSSLVNLSPEEAFQKIGDKLKETWNKIKRFFTPQDVYDDKGFKTNMKEIPAITWLKNVWNGLKNIVKQWMTDTGLSGVWDTLSGWWNTLSDTLEQGKQKVEKIWATVKKWWQDSGITEFLNDVWSWIRSGFQSNRTVEHGYRNGRLESWYSTEDAPVVSWLTGIWESIKDTWESVKKWEGWSTVYTFLNDTWAWISKQFTPTVESGYRNGRLESWYGEAPIVTWLTGIWETVSGFWNNTIIGTAKPVWEAIYQFGGNTWTWIKKQFTPTVESGYRNGKLESWYSDPPIVTWLNGVWEAVSGFWNDTIIGTAKPIWEAIYRFGSNTWAWIAEQFTPTVESGYRNGRLESWYSEPPVVTWLNGIWTTIQDFWNNTIVGTARPIWEAIYQFGSNTWSWIAEQFTPTVESGYRNGKLESWYAEPPVVGWLKGIWETISTFWNDTIVGTARPIWEAIFQFGTNTWAWIEKQFTPTVEHGYRNGRLESWYAEAPVVKFLSNIWQGILDTWKDISEWDGWEKVGKFLGDTWNWISEKAQVVFKAFTEPEENGATGFSNFLERVSGTIKKAWDTLTTSIDWESIGSFIANTWDWIMKAVGLTEEEPESEVKGSRLNRVGLLAAAGMSDVNYAVNQVTKESSNVTDTDAKNTEKRVSIFERIIGAITSLFTSIAEAASSVVNSPELRKFLEALGDFFMGLMNVITEVLKFANRFMTGQQSNEDLAILLGGGIVLALVTFINLWRSENLSNIAGSSTSIGTQFLQIAGGIMLIATAVSLLSTIKQEDMLVAAGVVLVMAFVVSRLLQGVNTIIQNTRRAEIETSGERVLKTLINTVGKVGMVAVALSLLPNIIKTIGEVKKEAGADIDIGGDLLNILLGLTAFIAGVSLALAASQAITGGKGLDIQATLKTTISVIGAIALFLTAAAAVVAITSTLLGDDPQGTIDRLNKVAEVAAAFGGILGVLISSVASGGTDEQKAKLAQNAMDQYDKIAQAFDMEKITGITRIMQFMVQLTRYSEQIDTKGIKNFADAATEFAIGINSIASYLMHAEGAAVEMADSESELMKKFRNFSNIGVMLSESLSPFGSTSWYLDKALKSIKNLAQEDNLDTLVKSMNTIMAGLEKLDDPNSGIQFDGLLIAKKLHDAIQVGISDPSMDPFDATSIVDAIISALLIGDSSIAQIVHDMVQNGINLSTLSEEQGGAGEINYDQSGLGVITQFFDGNGMPKSLDLSGLKEQLYGKDGKGGILGEMNGLADQIPSVESVFDTKGWMNFTDEEGDTIDLVGVLQSHLTDLSTSMEETKYHITITPVFDFSTLTPEALQSAFDSQFAANPLLARMTYQNPTESVDFTQIAVDLGITEIRDKLDLILAAITLADTNNGVAIGNLGVNINGISNAISGMNLVLDTGVLVGQITPMIDVALAQRSDVYERAGVVFTKF